MSMNKNHQAGSAATFVIIAVILLALLLGGIFYVVQRGEQARKDAAATKIANDAAAAKKAKDVADAAKAAAPTQPSTPGTSTPTTPTPTPTPSPALPATGIELDIVRIIAVGLLAGTVTSFVVSRRSLKHPL